MMSAPVAAQSISEEETEPETAETLIERTRDQFGPPPPVEDCTPEQERAIISGEIIVCRRIIDTSQRLRDSVEAERAYAEATMNVGNPRAPDLLLDCHDQGWPVGCVRFGKAPPPVYYVDFDELPEAPPGSDADRIARGLPPLGRDGVGELPTPEEVHARSDAASEASEGDTASP